MMENVPSVTSNNTGTTSFPRPLPFLRSDSACYRVPPGIDGGVHFSHIGFDAAAAGLDGRIRDELNPAVRELRHDFFNVPRVEVDSKDGLVLDLLHGCFEDALDDFVIFFAFLVNEPSGDSEGEFDKLAFGLGDAVADLFGDALHQTLEIVFVQVELFGDALDGFLLAVFNALEVGLLLDSVYINFGLGRRRRLLQFLLLDDVFFLERAYMEGSVRIEEHDAGRACHIVCGFELVDGGGGVAYGDGFFRQDSPVRAEFNDT